MRSCLAIHGLDIFSLPAGCAIASAQGRLAFWFHRLILVAACVTFAPQGALSQVTVSFPEPHNTVVLSVPDKPAALQVDLLSLKTDSNTLRQDLAGRRLEASDSHGWVFTSFLFPLTHKLDSKGLREEEWTDLRKGASKDGFKIEQIKIYERGSMPILEYVAEGFRGKKTHQKNVFGYMVSGDIGIDFHISKIGYAPEDQNFFDSLVNGIKLIENYEPDSKVQYGYGSMFYLQKDWLRAAQHYEKALDLEKTKRNLSATDWRVLVDNLGMAYGGSKNLERAKITFEYGVHEDSTYPMFHYNLACIYAELSDLSQALEELRTAFRYRNNSIPGEGGIPDPTKDDSFRRYLGNQTFQAATRELCPISTRSRWGIWECK